MFAGPFIGEFAFGNISGRHVLQLFIINPNSCHGDFHVANRAIISAMLCKNAKTVTGADSWRGFFVH
jgi:hypothetical protein